MKLENLKPAKGSVRNNNRLGRGQGSGGGGTATRGHKGAKSRSGYSSKRGFEGGQMPLQRRVPKFGFNNINRVEFKAINLDALQFLVEKTGVTKIDIPFLRENGLISKSDLIKVLGRGELKSKISVEANGFSKTAVSSIQSLGGSVTIIATYGSGSKALETLEVSSVVNNKEKKSVDEVSVDHKQMIASKEEVQIQSIETVDDLRKIEGIGPKIAELFVEAGIDTFDKLSKTEISVLENILIEAGGNFASHNPTTWPDQAALAAAGKWDELKVLQDKLDGGRPE